MRNPELHERGLLNVIQDIHMTNTGAMERADIDQDHDIKLIRERLKNWEKSHPHNLSDIYDGLVRLLAETAIKEWDHKLSHLSRA